MRLKEHIAFDFLQKGYIADAITKQYCPESIELLKDIDIKNMEVLGQEQV